MDLILITADPRRAAIAQKVGIDRLMVDLEMEGKEERQGHLNTVISRHTLDDIAAVRVAAPEVALMVRTDPWPHAKRQVEPALALGADVLMLPMFESAREVTEFVDQIGGRARVMLLLETPRALANLTSILAVPGVDEIHVGLNDLHLAQKRAFMFELLADGTVEQIGREVLATGIEFGFGGVARIGSLPLPAELVLSEHVRTGSTRVILSRDIQRVFDEADPEVALRRVVTDLRRTIDQWRTAPRARLEANAARLKRLVGEIVAARGGTT